MSDLNNDGPAVPINGPIPDDGEYRIVDDTVVEQWSEWAGMWDTAYHAAGKADARRYVREHSADEVSEYHVAGEYREQGATGTFTPFCTTVNATSVEDAREQAIIGMHLEHNAGETHVRVVVREIHARQRVEELADEYWRERRKPGGTIELESGGVEHSERCREIWEAMGPITEEAAEENLAALRRAGVAGKVAATASHYDIDMSATSLRWRGNFPGDGYDLDSLVSPPLRHIEEWSDGFRVVWTDDDRLIFTYCEGDLTGEVFFTPEAFKAAWDKATEFYKEH